MRYPEIAIAASRAQETEIIGKADAALSARPMHITDSIAKDSAGGRHDYFSQADYAWPNPQTPGGLPYITRDGQSFPGAFFDHRRAMRTMRKNVANFTAAYLITGDSKYAAAAVRWLKEFFLDAETKMNPSLLYSQAVLGDCTGRGIGIIDTLHLIDVPVAVDLLWEKGQIEKSIYEGLKHWFSEYLDWMCTHQYGIDEMNHWNNHGVCWHVQAAVFARFTGNNSVIKMCMDNYKKKLLPDQMANDGSFPKELARTKPYGYSIFIIDNLASLCYILSDADSNLWDFTLTDGRCVNKGLDFLYPYIKNRSSWPYKTDIAHHSEWPVAMSFMLFAAASFGEEKWTRLYSELEKYPVNDEVRRNTGIRVPYLWVYQGKQ